MNTPLQQAAQAVIDRWDSPLWKDQPHTGVYIAELRKAIAGEQAQAVEPVAWLVRWPVATHERRDINPWVALTIAEYRSNPSREERPLYTHSAPPPAKAQQVSAPYDQQALELCNECGWKAIMPGEPCFVCNMKTEAQQIAVPSWIPTTGKMPEPCTNVLAYNGKKQPIRAMWVPAKTLEDASDGDFGEYDEATDMYYWPEAWYETNAHEETHWMVDGHVTHWMPLPLPPQGGKP